MSTAIAVSAVAGYIFYSGQFTLQLVVVFTGVLLLAGSATALNQIQERHRDALMERTMDRPIPSGRMSLQTATLYTIIMGISGLLILYYLTTPLTAALGLLNILWYNGVYTPLKTKTGFVVIIGAVTGALPPMMGWTAAGGLLSDVKILFIAAFFFLWQIPHFLLLLLRYKEDYQKAGFISATSSLSDHQVKTVAFIWTLGTSLVTLLFPLFGIITGHFLIICIIVLNVLLITFFFRTTFNRSLTFNLGKAFGSLYLYQLLILTILIFQALI
jgi:protoheme IX farnesyltransferase